MKAARYAIITALTLLATALAARWLNRDILYIDEWWSIFKAGGDIYGPLSPVGVWSRIVEIDPGGMGAGYYITLNLWSALTGSTPLAVRTYSLLFGLLTIAMTYRIGASWFSVRTGMTAAALMAGSAFLINYMHEARAYTLVAFMTCCVIYAYWRVVTVPAPRFQHYAALTLAIAGLAYSHYVALIIPAAVAVYHVLRYSPTRRWWQISAAAVVAGLLYIPWIPVMIDVAQRGTGDTGRQASSMDAMEAVGELGVAFSNGSPALLVLLMAAAAWFIWRQPTRQFRTRAHQPTLLLAIWLAVGLAGALAVNAAVPFLVHLRYLIFLWPALALAGALGIHAISRQGIPAVLLVGIWLIFGTFQSLTPDFMRGLFGELYRPPAAGIDRAMQIIEADYHPDDLILFRIAQPGYENFSLFIEDYLTRNITGEFPNETPRAQTEFMNNSAGMRSDAAYREDVLAVLADHPHVWVVEVPEIPTTQRSMMLERTLAENYADCGMLMESETATLRIFAFHNIGIDILFREDDDESHWASVSFISNMGDTFGDFTLPLLWNVGENLPSGEYSASVKVIDTATGKLAFQDDYPLPASGYGCHTTRITTPLPAGDYSVDLSVYNWMTGAAIRVGFSEYVEVATLRVDHP